MSKNSVDPEKWVENYGEYLFSIARLKLNDHELARDLVGETFLSALQAISGFRSESNEKTWLIKILNNKIIDYYRKQKQSFIDLENYLDETEKSFFEGFFEPNKYTKNHWKEKKYPNKDFGFTDTQFEDQEFIAILDYCLSKIPPKLKPVFIARFFDEQDSKIICKEFGLTSSNYWVLIHRAKLVMRNCLEKSWIQ